MQKTGLLGLSLVLAGCQVPYSETPVAQAYPTYQHPGGSASATIVFESDREAIGRENQATYAWPFICRDGKTYSLLSESGEPVSLSVPAGERVTFGAKTRITHSGASKGCMKLATIEPRLGERLTLIMETTAGSPFQGVAFRNCSIRIFRATEDGPRSVYQYPADFDHCGDMKILGWGR